METGVYLVLDQDRLSRGESSIMGKQGYLWIYCRPNPHSPERDWGRKTRELLLWGGSCCSLLAVDGKVISGEEVPHPILLGDKVNCPVLKHGPRSLTSYRVEG